MSDKKKIYTIDEVKKNLKDRGKAEFYPEDEKKFDEMIDQADKDIEAKQSININIRWSKSEVERCKKLAAQKGLPYQTYIKSILKQAMDKEESA